MQSIRISEASIGNYYRSVLLYSYIQSQEAQIYVTAIKPESYTYFLKSGILSK